MPIYNKGWNKIACHNLYLHCSTKTVLKY